MVGLGSELTSSEELSSVDTSALWGASPPLALDRPFSSFTLHIQQKDTGPTFTTQTWNGTPPGLTAAVGYPRLGERALEYLSA